MPQHNRCLVVIALASIVMACGSPQSSESDREAGSIVTAEDAGGHDAGTESDAGSTEDGGVTTDAGDAHDAGEVLDAGEQFDAGAQVDDGQPDAGTAFAGTCASAIPLTFDSAGMATASGTLTAGTSAVSDGRCLSSGPELVYSFTLSSSHSFSARVTPSTTGFAPSLLLRSSNCAASSWDCAMAPASGPTELRVSPLSAGTWYVVVDSGGTVGDFLLEVELGTTLPKPGDACEAPYKASIGGSTIGSQQSGASLTSFSNDNVTATCDGTGADLVYKLNLTATRKVTLSLAASSSSPGYRPVLYLQRGTCSLDGSTECSAAPAAGGTAALNYAALPPGTYYIWLDGHSGTTGSFTFNYALEAP